MNNYPPGAANDPNAPYNQEDPPEVEVTVTETLVKVTYIYSYSSRVAEVYKNDHRTAEQCLNDSYRVIKALYDERKPNRFYEHVDLLHLLDDLEGWQTEEFSVNDSTFA
jgi:hypothetical protein